MRWFLFAVFVLFFSDVAGAGELQKAAGAGDIERVRGLIKAKPDGVSARDAGTTALHEATRAGHLDVVKLLVASGANVNATDFSGLTPLRLALGTRRLEIAEFLKQHGGLEKAGSAPPAAAPNTAVRQTSGLFATNSSVGSRSNVATAAATSNAAPPAAHAPAPRQPTEREMLPVIFPIHEAARVGDVEQIKFLFQNSPDIVNATDQKGLTPLHVAAANKQFFVAQTLLGFRAKVNVKAVSGQTPLHVAVRNGDVAITGLLITNRATVDARDNFENTSLLVALQSTDAEALDASGGLGARSTFVASNSLAAMRLQQFRLASLLIGARADVNARNRAGAAPLTESVRLGNEQVVNLLLANGANPNIAEPSTARTPLHMAAMRGRRVIVESLLRSRAAVNAADKRGETPLCYALREGRTNTIAILRAAGGTTGSTRPMDSMEKSLVEFYQRMETALQRTSASEKGKTLIALNPTRADCERMFPKHAAAAWKVVDEINRQIKIAFAKPLPDAEQGKEIWRILPESPSPVIQEWRSRGLLSKDLPVFSLAVEKIGASTRPGDYCFVNGHWVMIPPVRNVAAQVAAAEVPKK